MLFPIQLSLQLQLLLEGKLSIFKHSSYGAGNYGKILNSNP
jgi:hypothetical protein